MEQIGCKECTSPDCRGCNLLRLEQMLNSGKFDVLMDEKRGIKTGIDVRPVVTCSDCKWWTKQEASLQGRCELLQMYPTGAWFCANGKREES